MRMGGIGVAIVSVMTPIIEVSFWFGPSTVTRAEYRAITECRAHVVRTYVAAPGRALGEWAAAQRNATGEAPVKWTAKTIAA